MPNVQDHALEIGGQSLAQRPFDALDGLILTQLCYMPMEGRLDKGERCTVKEAWEYLKDNCDPAKLDQFQRKRYRLTEVCAGLPRYADWVWQHYVNLIDNEREMQFCASTYCTGTGLRYIAFRGTDLTVAGWKEDLNMSFMTVPSQVEAAEYISRESEDNGDALMLGGHSKGGNLAVYAAVHADPSTRERIRVVNSFDGPGLDEETLNSDAYQLIRERIDSFIPQSSVVGMLLHYHPVYTVVKAKSAGILQHDAMTWQVEDGDFVRLKDVDMSGKITDEATHAWLAGMGTEDRRLLVETLYRVVDAGQAELVTDLTDDWRESASRSLEAIRELDPAIKKDVLRMLRSLFSTGASEVVRMALPQLAKLGKPKEQPAE